MSRRRPPTTPVSSQNRRAPLCNDGISPQDTSFPLMSLDSLPNVGMRIDNDIDDYGSDSELSINNSGQFNSTLNNFVPRYIYLVSRDHHSVYCGPGRWSVIYIHTHAHMHTRTHTHTHTHTHIHIHTYIHAYTYIHTHTRTHTHTYIYIHIHTYIHTYNTCNSVSGFKYLM